MSGIGGNCTNYSTHYTGCDCHEARHTAIATLLRRAAVELEYVQLMSQDSRAYDGGPSNQLFASANGAAIIQEAETLLGPMRNWPEVE